MATIAAISVYPEPGGVLQAAKGDGGRSTLGWNKPPQSFLRTLERHRLPSSF